MHIISLLLLLLASKPNFIQTICMLTNNDNNNFADSLFASFVTCIQAHYEYIKCCRTSAIFEVPIHFTETTFQSNVIRSVYIYQSNFDIMARYNLFHVSKIATVMSGVRLRFVRNFLLVVSMLESRKWMHTIAGHLVLKAMDG